MADIKVDIRRLRTAELHERLAARKLQTGYREIESIRRGIRYKIAAKQQIDRNLRLVLQQVNLEYQRTTGLSEGLVKIISLYEQTERNNVSLLKTEYHVDSVVFDDVGGYGGNQGHMEQVYYWDPIKCWELLDDLRKYYPNMSILEAFSYFSQLNSVGCGYVALANTLFMEYADRPGEFERIFGYPMYKNGDLNYDRLILDIYATTDKAGFNDGSNGRPQGTYDSTRAMIMQYFLKDKGVSVTTEANVDVNAHNFRSITESGGYVILGYRNGNMYDENGNAHPINGGHAITVTGVTDDGRYIVSSWGEKYYINASDIGDDDTFMVFRYNDSAGSENSGHKSPECILNSERYR